MATTMLVSCSVLIYSALHTIHIFMNYEFDLNGEHAAKSVSERMKMNISVAQKII